MKIICIPLFFLSALPWEFLIVLLQIGDLEPLGPLLCPLRIPEHLNYVLVEGSPALVLLAQVNDLLVVNGSQARQRISEIENKDYSQE